MKKYLLILCALMLTAVGASAQYVDYTSKMSTATTDWSVTGTNLTSVSAGTFRTGMEYYNDDASGNAFNGLDMSQTITDLPAGTYTVSFYAAVNEANSSSYNQSGTEFRAYVQDATVEGNYETGTVGTLSAAGISWGDNDDLPLYTFTVTLTEGQSLKYGISNTGGGGNWAIIQPVSLILSVDAQTEGDVVHDCLVIMGIYNSTADRATPIEWSSEEAAVGNFHVNTWSTEGASDGTGMTTPFIEYWFGSGNNVADAVLSHETLTGLTPGLYEVSVLARAYNEGSSTAVGAGITFNANSASVDLTTGTVTSGTTPAMAYGTYTVIAEVGDAGTLDINFTIQSETSCDWLAWKDLKVVYDGESLPTLDYVEGDMNADVEQAMKTAVDAYNASKSSADYTAALAAIEAAEESVAQYAEIAALVDKLDTDGSAVWATTTSGQAYTAKTLTTSDDITDDMVAAQRAQTSANTDWSYVVKNTGTWVNAISATNFQNCPSLPTAHEIWSANAWTLSDGVTSAEAIYKRIEDLPAGEYTISFYAYGNAAENASQPLAFANDSETEVAYASALVWNESSLYTLQCTVGVDKTLTFGMKTQGAGNWYVMEEGSLTLVSLAEEATDTKSDYSNGDKATIYGHKYDVKSDNMVENHSFELGFTGWTGANDFATEITASNFELRSDGAQDGEVYLVGTVNGGSSAASSLGTAWAIEAGKTYYFSYYVKNLTTNAQLDTEYLKTSLTNTLGTETIEFSEPESVSADWQKVEYLFTNTNYEYVQVKFRWLNNQWGFDNFQLYQVEPAEDVLEGVSDDSEYTTGEEVTVDGKAYTVVGDNMFVNGGFNADMYGWTAAGYYVAADPDNFDVEEEGGFNEGAYLIASSGGTGNVKTPSQAIAVEEGKTYLFIGYTSGTTPKEDSSDQNLQYSALFKMSDAVTEASSDKIIVQMLWGAESQQESDTWTQTMAVFTAETEYVGMRMGWSGGSYDGFQLYEVEATGEVAIDWEMTEAGWGTMILPFDADVPEGLTMYAGDALELSSDGTTITVSEASETIVANTPYLISGTAGTYTFTGTAEEATSLTSGMLTGTYETLDCDALLAAAGTNTVYLLQDQGDGATFYPVVETESAEATLTPYHCYLTISSTISPDALHLPGMATAIKAVESETLANDAIYDLSGRRVSKAVKGVYIQNGKKVLVK